MTFELASHDGKNENIWRKRRRAVATALPLAFLHMKLLACLKRVAQLVCLEFAREPILLSCAFRCGSFLLNICVTFYGRCLSLAHTHSGHESFSAPSHPVSTTANEKSIRESTCFADVIHGSTCAEHYTN